MKEERMQILKMVEEKIITVDEAARLFDSLGTASCKSEGREFEEKVAHFSKNVSVFAKDVGAKMEGAFRDVEPKVKKATRTVLEKTAVVLDDMARSINENLKKYEEECGCECGCGCEEEHEYKEDDRSN